MGEALPAALGDDTAPALTQTSLSDNRINLPSNDAYAFRPAISFQHLLGRLQTLSRHTSILGPENWF